MRAAIVALLLVIVCAWVAGARSRTQRAAKAADVVFILSAAALTALII